MDFTKFLMAKHQPLMDLCWHLLMYSSVTLMHTRTSAPAYKRTFRKTSNLPLVIHMIAGLSEVFRLPVRRVLSSGPVVPDHLDLALTLAHSWSIMVLSKTLLRGSKLLTRPSYQAGAVLRTLTSVAAFALRSPELHHGSVRVINGFIYTRAIIFVICKLDLLRSYSDTYAVAVFLAGLLSTYESAVPVAMPLYIAFVLGIFILNRWVSSEVHSRNIRIGAHYPLLSKERFILLLAHVGFAELDTIKQLENPSALSSEIRDDYVLNDTTKETVSDPPIASPAHATPASMGAQMRHMRSGMRSRILNKGQRRHARRQSSLWADVSRVRRQNLSVSFDGAY